MACTIADVLEEERQSSAECLEMCNGRFIEDRVEGTEAGISW